MADPLLAAVLSFVVPGLGQVYNGRFLRGAAVFLLSWTVIVYLWGIYDAYRLASDEDR